MKKNDSFRAHKATSQKTSAHSNKRSVNSYSPATYREAEDLVGLFRRNGVPDDVTSQVFDTLLDMADLDVEAMVIALNQVKTFLHQMIPIPTENEIINITVLHIMSLIIESREENDEDNYRKHHNKKQK